MLYFSFMLYYHQAFHMIYVESIRRLASFMFFKIIDRRIFKLRNYERVGRVSGIQGRQLKHWPSTVLEPQEQSSKIVKGSVGTRSWVKKPRRAIFATKKIDNVRSGYDIKNSRFLVHIMRNRDLKYKSNSSTSTFSANAQWIPWILRILVTPINVALTQP